MRKKILFPAALLLLVFSFVLSLCVGSAQISIHEAVSALQNGSLTPDSRILFVNDGSRDKTAALCRAHGYRLIDLPVNLGLAGAFRAPLPPCSRAQHLRSPVCSCRMS